MKSFRLDPDSVRDITEGWPVFLVALMLSIPVSLFATTFLWGRILVSLLLGVALGQRLSGRLRQSYPTANHLWLLSIGMSTMIVGVAVRMAFPVWQGTAFDLSWLGVAFFAILAFMLLNRGNKKVIS